MLWTENSARQWGEANPVSTYLWQIRGFPKTAQFPACLPSIFCNSSPSPHRHHHPGPFTFLTLISCPFFYLFLETNTHRNYRRRVFPWFVVSQPLWEQFTRVANVSRSIHLFLFFSLRKMNQRNATRTKENWKTKLAARRLRK